NQISRIENLPDGLQSLNLEGNQISSLDGLSILLLEQLGEIDLRDNPIQDIPSDALNDKSSILGYLKSKEQHEQVVQNTFLKMNIIGEGRIGKTQFFNFLQGKPYQPNARETHGTNTLLYHVPESDIQAMVWDFGGQSYHHGFHKVFLGRTDFNIVLWRNQADQKPDYGYWLGTARRAFTSDQKDSRYLYPLLLVQNVWHDSDSASDVICYPDSRQTARYQIGLDDVFAIDVKNLFDADSSWRLRHQYFLAQLHQRMIAHAQRYEVSQIWLDIKRDLDNDPVTDINLKKDTFRANYASAISDNDIFEGLLAYLAFTGSILQFRDNPVLQNYVFPNPPALSNWLYGTILDEEFKRKNQGRISRSALKQKLKTAEKIEIFIALMLSFELIFEQPQQDQANQSETYYIIPQFLPEFQHSFKNVLLDLLPFTFSLKFPDFMHEGRMFQFIATYGKYAIDNTAYWKYGLLYNHETNSTATNTLRVVVFYLPDKRQLMVHIEDKKGRSDVARELFDYFVFEINPVPIRPQPTLPSARKQEGDSLEAADENMGQKELSPMPDDQTYRKELSRSRDFENLKMPVHLSTQSPYFFDVVETAKNIKVNNFFGVCEDTQQRVKLNFMAINLLSTENSRKLRVFFSYSHKDEQYRNELETHCAMLKRSGRIETWHDRKIVAGEAWDEKIKDQLQQADIVLLMISADFLNSDYIWEHELGIVRERYQNQDGIRPIPIFTRPCDMKDLDFMKLQGGQRDHQSQLPWISSSPDRDKTYMDIVREIRKSIESMR
ncbi:MAG: TIR domain-containing protein, partial [Rudanella sp.]|nr:TIR domain-containing protein [Rudanella sp.]